jgi:hypothetical protein
VFVKTVKYVPEICKVEGSSWSGFIMLKLPTFDQKCEYIDQIQSLMEEYSGLDETKKNMRIARAMVKMSAEHYESCELVHTNGTVVKSFDDLQYVESLHGTLVEVSGLMAQGFKVGNV